MLTGMIKFTSKFFWYVLPVKNKDCPAHHTGAIREVERVHYNFFQSAKAEPKGRRSRLSLNNILNINCSNITLIVQQKRSGP